MLKPEIIHDYLTDEEIQVISDYAHEKHGEPRRIWLRPLGRFGYTDAKLLRCYFHGREGRFPFVIKLDKPEYISKELYGFGVLRHFKSLNIPDTIDTDQNANLICYQLYSNRTDEKGNENILELKDLLYMSSTCNKAEKTLKKVFGNHLKALRDASEWKPDVNIYKDYDRYLRGANVDGSKFHRILAANLGKKIKDGKICFLNSEIIDPRYLLPKLKDHKLPVHMGTIHGDLHANNIVITEDKNLHLTPHLIDFAWGEKNTHILKDYALMELSLRLALFPHYADLEMHLKFDRLLIKNELDKLDSLEKEAEETILASEYRYLSKYIKIIRQYAMECYKKHKCDFVSHYNICQFLLLVGLIKYPEYNPYLSLRLLGLLAKQISEDGLIR